MADNNNPNVVNATAAPSVAPVEKASPAPKKEETSSSLPFPHNALGSVNVEGSAYKDLISEAYAEHEAALKNKAESAYAPDAELLAAREDAQERLAAELKASLKFQRSLLRENEQKGGVRIKLVQDHIHGGVAYKAGEEISVDQTSADYIVHCGAGKKL